MLLSTRVAQGRRGTGCRRIRRKRARARGLLLIEAATEGLAAPAAASGCTAETVGHAADATGAAAHSHAGSAAEAGNSRFALRLVGRYSGAGKKYGACRCRYYACDIHFNLLFIGLSLDCKASYLLQL